MIKNKRILITGVEGFTGAYLYKEMTLMGAEVFGLVNSQSHNSNFYECDILDFNRLSDIVKKIKPQIIVHLAAISFVGEKDQSSFYNVNVIGTCNLMRSVEKVNCIEKVLVASSANVYGAPKSTDKINELLEPAPINHYAASKLAMEHMVKTWTDILPIIIVRPFNYTGPGQSQNFLIPKLVTHFKNKSTEIELGNLDISRDFTSIYDLISAYVLLLNSEASNTTVNVCSGNAISFKSIFSLLSELTGHKLNIITNEKLKRKNEISYIVGDNTLISSLVGWKPKIQLKDILEDMLIKSGI